MCTGNCFDNSTINIPNGPAGAQGAQGIQGEYGGFASNWLFSNSTSNGTSLTELRLNDASPASVTAIYVNDSNGDSTDLSGFLASLSNSNNYGRIRLFKEDDSNTIIMLDLTGVTDNTSEYEYAVTYIDHNNTFSSGDSIVLEFTPRGAQGEQGSAAASSLTNETFINLEEVGGFSSSETLISGATYTFSEAGTYQVHITTSLYVRPGTPTGATYIAWYLDSSQQQRKDVVKSTAGTNIENKYPSFIWRGTVTAGQVLEVRGLLGAGSAQCSVDAISVLINKEV